MKSALAGYIQHDFIKFIESYGISYHEKTLGQLFCDGSAKKIIQMLVVGYIMTLLLPIKKTKFRENIFFTHKGLSGPAILQISSYLETFDSEERTINLLPDLDLAQEFTVHKNNKQTPVNYLKTHLTNRLAENLATTPEYHKTITDLKKESLMVIAERIHNFRVMVNGSAGYQKAAVTVGGVNTNELSSKTMECKNVPGNQVLPQG